MSDLLLFDAGHWLGVKMSEGGATDEECYSASFVLGQHCLANVCVPDAYALAAEAYDRWREGRPDRGGLELAKTLIGEAKR